MKKNIIILNYILYMLKKYNKDINNSDMLLMFKLLIIYLILFTIFIYYTNSIITTIIITFIIMSYFLKKQVIYNINIYILLKKLIKQTPDLSTISINEKEASELGIEKGEHYNYVINIIKREKN